MKIQHRQKMMESEIEELSRRQQLENKIATQHMAVLAAVEDASKKEIEFLEQRYALLLTSCYGLLSD
jgi:hypothetical protein